MRVQLYAPIAPEYGINMFSGGITPEDLGIINQRGLNRKVSLLRSGLSW